MTGCDIATPTTVYAWTDSREKFDSLKLPVKVFNWYADKVVTMIKNDGHEWERRIHSKEIEQNGVLVMIQFYEERPIERAA